MWRDNRISVVFPAYNEAENIERAVSDFLALKNERHTELVDEILVVDNNSLDGTPEIAKRAGARVVSEVNQGYGYALQRGLRDAEGDLIVLSEPDGTFICEDILKLLVYSQDFEMVCGTRTTRELIWHEANMRWFLRLGNFAVAKLMEILYSTPSLSDCGCTFRLIHRSAVEKIMPHLHVGASHFLPNMVIAARTVGVSFIEIPVSYRGRIGTSKITGTFTGSLKTGLSMIGLILSSWPFFIAKKPKKDLLSLANNKKRA